MKKAHVLWALVALALAIGGYVVFFADGDDAAGGSGGPPWAQGDGARPPAVVDTAPVSEGRFVARADFVGALSAAATADLYAKVPGQVTRLYADTGDTVSAGQVLAQIEADQEARKIEQAQASLEMTRASLAQREAAVRIAEATARRTRNLADQQLVSDQQKDTIEAELEEAVAQLALGRAQITESRAALSAAQVELERTRIRAPFDGVVGKRYLDRGARAGTNDPIFTLVDLSPMKVTVPLTARDAARVTPGQAAQMQADAFPERTFEGRVARLSSLFDPETHTTEAEIEVDNPTGVLKPGMFVRLAITFDTAGRALLVPEAAVVEDEDATYVLVAEPAAAGEPNASGAADAPRGGPPSGGPPIGAAPSHRARRVSVEPLGVGLDLEDTTAVATAGGGTLSAGERVITLGQGDLADGAPLTLSGPTTGPGTARSGSPQRAPSE